MKSEWIRLAIAFTLVVGFGTPMAVQAQFGSTNDSQDFFQQGQFELNQEIQRLQKNDETQVDESDEPLTIKEHPEADKGAPPSSSSELEDDVSTPTEAD